MPFGDVADFNDVFRQEISVINERRRNQQPARDPIVLGDEGSDSTGEAVLVPNEESNVIGLALSGGGIRSAAFCLGALQSLNETEVLKRVDYLSTVSGGGYIGCSLSAGLDATQGDFPFESRVVEDETPSLQHIRDYSNYLFPHGAADVLDNVAIYVRGLVANFILIMPFVLIAAALTIVVNPTVQDLQHSSLIGTRIPNIFPFEHFVVTAYLTLVLLALAIVWGLLRSRVSAQGQSEVPSGWTTFVGAAALVALFSAFCELQPFLLAEMFSQKAEALVTQKPGLFVTTLSKLINTISLVLAPIAAAFAFLGRQLGELVKSATESSRTRVQIAGYAAKAAIYFAAIIVPLLLWAIYLGVTSRGICVNGTNPICPAPDWVRYIALHVLGEYPSDKLYLLVAGGYLVIAAIFLVLAGFLRPNANSLHPLYRDRLGKAFLFEPQTTLRKYEELKPLKKRLSELSGKFGPYHLINTALNIQNSKTANKRGRNADFFSFSRDFVGSEATRYVATRDVEQITTGLDLATVMAISGAAASANMGAQSIKPLTPTLAILNIRLGYWLRNPLQLTQAKSWNRWANFYFIAELFGRLNEHWRSVYLTDGGHIENLGIYELLKRRCRVIIAVDAEADSELAFGSFNTLVRYARIDLGLEIDLPWEQIADVSRATGNAIEEYGDSPKLKGPHCAIGQITYPGGRKGILVYIKSSLTGDENDYVFHYKKRYPRFPHETTVDQMFSEEQFEAYRALGYHAAYGLFDRRDNFAQLDPSEYPQAREQVGLLDHLFPRVTTGGPPGQRQRLVDWLPPVPPRIPVG
jgi:predicted acylesterase/phospholipase RssA